jgi:hypothetical protein
VFGGVTLSLGLVGARELGLTGGFLTGSITKKKPDMQSWKYPFCNISVVSTDLISPGKTVPGAWQGASKMVRVSPGVIFICISPLVGQSQFT